MWKGKVTAELKELAYKYTELFDGEYVDGYDELCYDVMSYDEFVGYIKEAIETHRPLTEVVP